MICEKPYQIGIQVFPCGKCMACRMRRGKEWAHRIMLETFQHPHSAFVTLTYSDENLPLCKYGTAPSLRARDAQLWLKRLRRRIEPMRVRYYLVGEYGDTTHRPHYHAILFGYKSCLKGISQYTRTQTSCCSQCDIVKETWGLGLVSLGSVTIASAQYLSGYITKGLQRWDDPRLNGRDPEFARMSLVPGIGAFAADDVASEMMRYDLEETVDDVPSGLDHGKKRRSFGRYIQRRLRARVGRDQASPVTAARIEKMQDLFYRSVASKEGRSVSKQVSVESEGTINSLKQKWSNRRGKL